LKKEQGRKWQFFDRPRKFPTEFQQAAKNFQQKKLCLLKISILTPTISKSEVSCPNFCIFRTEVFQQREKFPTAQNLQGTTTLLPLRLATSPHNSVAVISRNYTTQTIAARQHNSRYQEVHSKAGIHNVIK